jgi:transposase
LETNGVRVAAAVEPLRFVPVIVDASPARIATPIEKRQHQSKAGAIELEIDGVTVNIAFGADKRTIAAVIEALKATR